MAVPTPPTALVDVGVVDELRRGVPLAVVVREQDGDEPGFGPHADRLGVDAGWLAAAGFRGSAGSALPVALPGARSEAGAAGRSEARSGARAPAGWVVGVGKGTAADYRRAGAGLIKAVDARAAVDGGHDRPVARSLQVALPEDLHAEQAAAFAMGAALGSYRYAVTGQKPPPRTRSVGLVGPADLADPVRRALLLAGATALSRDLANTPSNVKDPSWLAAAAARIAGGVPGLKVQVRDEGWLHERGFGGLLAVGGGSSRRPRLVELSWAPRAARRARHLVLVGKGITFDTGGISIKPAENMHVMRTDMAGGGAVIAALVAMARLELPVRVTGLVPLAENHVSGSSYRPGDIVRHYDRRTTEVSNTDAEGRMVLADAIGYAVRTLRPDLLVDVATLTGAMRVALGWRTGGFFATDDELAERLTAAGQRADEAWWRMPLGFDVVDLATGQADRVRSETADVLQCPPGPGAISAALFLREFTAGLPWMHLDIAGAARSEKAYDDVTAGATGFAARTLVELAADLAG